MSLNINYKNIFNDKNYEYINIIDINYNKVINTDIYFDDSFEELVYNIIIKILIILYTFEDLKWDKIV